MALKNLHQLDIILAYGMHVTFIMFLSDVGIFTQQFLMF